MDKIQLIIEALDKSDAAFNSLKRHLKDSQVDTDALNVKSQGLTGAYKQLASGIRTLISAYAGYKLLDLVKDAALAAARYETLGLVMRVVGNNAGYTGEQMDAFAKGLEKTGISMSGARDSLTRMAQAQLDLNKSSELARMAQDAARIGNINSTEAFQRLVYGIQSAQTEMLRTIGINVSFENAYQRVAKETGRAATSFTEAEKSAIRMNAVLDKGSTIAGTYTESMKTAAGQLKSLERHFDNLKVAAGAAFTPALAEIVQTITEAVTGLNGELSGNGKKAVEEWGANLRLTIISVEAEFMRLGMFIDKIGGTMTQMKMFLSMPGTALGLDASTKNFDASLKQNEALAKRYKDTEKALEQLALRYNQIEYSLTPAGKAAAKAAGDAAEKLRMAAAAKNKAGVGGGAGGGDKAAVKERQKAFDALVKSTDAGEQEANDAQQKYWLDGWKQVYQDQEKAKKDLIEKTDAGEQEAYAAQIKYEIDSFREMEKNAKDKADTYRKMYDDMKGNTQEYYAFQLKALDEERKKYEKLTGDKLLTDKWYLKRKKELDQDLAISGDDFVKGMLAQHEILNDSLITMGQAGSEMMKSVSVSMKTTFSDVFMDSWTGKLKSAKDYFRAFAESIAKTWADMCSQMISDWIRQQIITGITKIAGSVAGGYSGGGGEGMTSAGWTGTSGGGTVATNASGWHGGGVPGADRPSFYRIVPAGMFAHAKRYHEGIGPGEEAAVIKKDEGVFTAGQMKAMGAIMNRQAEPAVVKVNITNVTSPDLLDAHLATGRGQNSILNVISSRAGTIKRILGSA